MVSNFQLCKVVYQTSVGYLSWAHLVLRFGLWFIAVAGLVKMGGPKGAAHDNHYEIVMSPTRLNE